MRKTFRQNNVKWISFCQIFILINAKKAERKNRNKNQKQQKTHLSETILRIPGDRRTDAKFVYFVLPAPALFRMRRLKLFLTPNRNGIKTGGRTSFGAHGKLAGKTTTTTTKIRRNKQNELNSIWTSASDSGNNLSTATLTSPFFFQALVFCVKS